MSFENADILVNPHVIPRPGRLKSTSNLMNLVNNAWDYSLAFK